MNRDSTVYVLGEEVARYNGAYKASRGERRNLAVELDRILTKSLFTGHEGSARQVRRGSSHRHSYHRDGFRRSRRRFRLGRSSSRL